LSGVALAKTDVRHKVADKFKPPVLRVVVEFKSLIDWESRMLKQKVKDRFHHSLIGNILEGFRIGKTYRQWINSGEPATVPQFSKQLAIKTFAQKYGIRVFIETGTYLGDMVAAVCHDFDKIYSIELSEDLFKQAQKRFARYKHITVVQGDSPRVMPEILKRIDVPCLFWLDGHYSAGIKVKGEIVMPIFKELNHIFGHPVKNHIILIDDASLFVGKNDYPSIESMQKLINSRLPHHFFDVRDDIIRIYK
jgi:hypothetical protein